VRLTLAQWIELSTDGQTDFGAIGTVSTNPGVQGRQEDTLQNDCENKSMTSKSER
jgi:hypothetical protein